MGLPHQEFNSAPQLQEPQGEGALLANIAINPDDDQAYFQNLPPGYRFWPMDSELIVHYLRKKIAKEVLPLNQIRDFNVYSDSPYNISEMYPPIGKREWYFFTPRDRKYPNGSRPSRAAGSGYWKANGGKKQKIKHNGAVVGYRWTLAFFEGKPPKGVKTNWIMHEFIVNGPPKKSNNDDMRLDDFVMCRIYNRTANTSQKWPRDEDPEDVDQNGYPNQQGNESAVD